MKQVPFIIFSLFSFAIFSQEVNVSSGKLQRFANFKSKYIATRNIDVWFPEDYSSAKKYSVLYMHDGQMLFDASTTWNKQAWEVDEIAAKLIAQNKTSNFIVVGIYNNGDYRHSEYFPQKMIRLIPEKAQKIIVSDQLKNNPQADNYLKFIVNELKPFIDKNFSTLKNQSNTFIAGSSMGGLISLYAICEYPKVFGGAACLSTHTPMIGKTYSTINIEDDLASKFRQYLSKKLPNPKNHKIYFDYGDQTLDAYYKPFQEKIDQLMIKKGFSDKSWITKFYAGDDHSEKSWRKRFDVPLLFLFSK